MGGQSQIAGADMLNAYWLSDETLPQAVSLKDIYGSTFQINEFRTPFA